MLNSKALTAKILTAIAQIIESDLVIEQGVDETGWHYKKYASGYLEAERARNIGQYTVSTVETAPIYVGGTLTSALPSMAVSGQVEVSLMGNSVNSPCFLERISTSSWRVAKVGSVTLQGVTVCERTINARWKAMVGGVARKVLNALQSLTFKEVVAC